jgi:hypothetical protein
MMPHSLLLVLLVVLAPHAWAQDTLQLPFPVGHSFGPFIRFSRLDRDSLMASN